VGDPASASPADPAETSSSSRIETRSGSRRHLLSLAVRFVAGAYFAMVGYTFWLHFLQTGRLTSLVYMFAEGLAVLLFVVRRETDDVSRRPVDWLLGSTAVLLPLLFRPAEGGLLPDGMGVVLQLAGVGIDTAGKLSLGRSFGVVAANRGVVRGGIYRLVRHPIYLGYVISYLGFVLANSSPRNLAVYVVGLVCIVARTRVEERHLLQDAAYVEYAGRVRYRLIPRLF